MRKILLPALIVVSFLGVVSGADESPLTRYRDNLPVTEKGRLDLAKLKSEREKQIEILMAVVRTGGESRQKKGLTYFSWNDPEPVGITMLGKLHAAESVDLLLERVEVRIEDCFAGVRFAHLDNIAVISLGEIGKPASTKALEYLAKEKSPDRAWLYVRVIFRVEGAELGKEMVRMAIAMEKDPTKKARLEKALAFFPPKLVERAEPQTPARRSPPPGTAEGGVTFAYQRIASYQEPHAQPPAPAAGPRTPDPNEIQRNNLVKLGSDNWYLIFLLKHIVQWEAAAREKKDRFSIETTDAEAVALTMLGELRAAEGVDLLLDRIDLKIGKGGDPSAGGEELVLKALEKIGKPASVRSVDYLSKDKSVERAKLYVRLITRIEGKELGKEMVRLALEKEKDPAKKERLKAALELFKDADKPIP